MSTEDLARVDAEVARRVVQDLGPERVRVLTVVRRLDRLLPSQWQQRAQGFRPEDFDEYLHAVLDRDVPADHPARRPFWASHDVGKVLRTWAGEAGADRVIALVADETDRALLPRTFEGLLGLPVGMLEDYAGSNPSLSYNGVEVIRRLNLLAQERGWPDEVYSRYVREDGPRDEGRGPLGGRPRRAPTAGLGGRPGAGAERGESRRGGRVGCARGR